MGAYCKYMESLEKKVSPEKGSERLRVSVANLVQSLRIAETGERHYFGVLNPTKFKEGKRQFQPLGGGAEITPQAKAALETLGAEFGKGMDARFSIPKEYFEEVYMRFVEENPEFFERDVRREMREELCDEEIPGIPAVLTPEEVEHVQIVYRGVVSQMPVTGTLDTSPNAGDIPVRRLFHNFELVVPKDIFEKMRHSEALHFYSDAELERIESGGMEQTALTEKGEKISNNTIVTPFFDE